MESESQEFEAGTAMGGFFEGLCVAPKLTQKQQFLRHSIREDTRLQSKQTSLQHKIERHQRFKGREQASMGEGEVFREKVIIDDRPKGKKNPEVTASQQSRAVKQKSFQDLRLIRPLLKSIGELGYVKPTPIQQLAIPVIVSGKDVVASSITGSGKTAAFLLPIMQRYFNVAPVGYIRALVVTPTRELAIQIYEQFNKLNRYVRMEGALVIGASSVQKQEVALRNNPEIVIATPGRLIDVLINSRSVGIENLQVLVFDEADKLLELGFENEVKQIMRHCNPEVQTVLFTATAGPHIDRLARDTTRKPIRVSADPDHKTADKLHQQIVKLREDSEEYRQAVLLSTLTQLYKERVIIFFKTKKECHRVAMVAGLLGLKACELHGNLSQGQRTQAFLDFKEGRFDYLLATDLAARGLDIKHVKTVINYELPAHITKYIHRIGRTARAGEGGTSLTLCSDAECRQIKRMSKKTGDKLFKLTVNEEAVEKYRRTIAGLGREIAAIIGEEREEREIRKAEMELKKLQNLKDYQTEIYSRPRKEWFITEKEKKTVQDRAREETGEQLPETKTKKIFKGREGFKGRGFGKPNGRTNGRPDHRSNNKNNKISSRNNPRPRNKPNKGLNAPNRAQRK